jgi:membrane-associated protease RseP (regulator of RpoE activity)
VEVFVAHPPKRRTWLYVFFLFLTVFTTLVVGANMAENFRQGLSAFSLSDKPLSYFPITDILRHPSSLLLGVPFSATLMLILFAHEMGHYLFCRYYRVNATLPFFVPFPSLFGTMGAFIRIKSPIPSRSALFDIGIAGPIAGFVFALPALAVGLRLSQPMRGVSLLPEVELGYPLIFHWASRLMGGTASPLSHVNLHPVAIAAWVGMFATALNLLPGGQLDGGHILFSISPRLHTMVSRLTILVLIPMAIYGWVGWLLWAVLLALSGMRHPQIADWRGIGRERKWLAVLALLMLLLTLTPKPILHSSLKEVRQELRSNQ